MLCGLYEEVNIKSTYKNKKTLQIKTQLYILNSARKM